MDNEQPIPDFSPHPFAEWFIIIVLVVPLIALLIWMIKEPEEGYLFGKRWMFRSEPELSEDGVFFTRLSSIIALAIILLILLVFIFR
ncbi:hypothetical protein CEY16_06445 [Halalkalibacillus sediminis]|uniref:DUF6199 domain-containing protein n=1 Tax=Halalkalibacillus sediminis TaxID=2018042 RepID=A0A2I0QTE6_9BACI|nr:hypothetical protein [Halalkalibacillus sediminis]PKR77574.1 hypothetical protein CEY16_06445 [Halalkalibacillus sediminis]